MSHHPHSHRRNSANSVAAGTIDTHASHQPASITRLYRFVRQWLINMFRPRASSFGVQGERLAARFLKRLGYKIIFHGDRSQYGEIDLVAVDGRTIVFVEVKSRRSSEPADALCAVDRNKQRRMTRAALALMRRHNLLQNPARFDVIAINWPEHRRRPTIEHIQNAFASEDRGQMFS